MPSLQELLSQSITQNLGISDVIGRKQQEAQRLGQVQVQKAGIQAQSELRRQEEERRKEQERKASEAGFFQTIGAVLGGLVGGPAGASIGSGIGGALAGGAAQPEGSGSQLVRQGFGLAAQFGQQERATRAAAQQAAQQQRAQEAAIGKTVAETGLIKAKTAKELLTKLPKDDALKKAVLDLQAKGARLAKQSDIEKLPSQAFINLGEGENQVTLVKPVKPLAAEAATKFAVARKARSGAQDLLKQFETVKEIGNILRTAGTKFAKKIPSAQKAAAKLDLVTEGLGRALSGAAVPESEIKSFRSLFAVNTTDTDEVIKFKLQRSIDIVNDLENLMKFGASTTDIEDYIDNQKAQIQNITNQAKTSAQDVAKQPKRTIAGIPVDDLTPEEKLALKQAGLF